eukprot:TRINITY_DN628_c0_g1_i1.p1 TRINITY_DN628_c0_g1~~TRINITY_DN628_c0_g1_i1.p1  ORF type:complete len:276 (-),score=35.55 TRINITY_DN628_c0_g1_i1:48-815(-)
MSYVVFFSGLFWSYAWALALFICVISKSAQLVILAIGSCFFWLISMLVASIVINIPGLKHIYLWIIPISVIFQELGRFVFWKLYYKAYSKLSFGNDDTKPSNFVSALTIGWGFGFCSALVLYTSLMWASSGPGYYATPACESISVFHIGGLISQAFVLLHVMWSIIGYDAYLKKIWWKIAFIFVTHLGASFLTLFNMKGGNCIGSVVGIYCVLIVVIGATWRFMTTPNSLLSYGGYVDTTDIRFVTINQNEDKSL